MSFTLLKNFLPDLPEDLSSVSESFFAIQQPLCVMR